MTWETEIASIENYYANLLIIQYRNKPKARATIKLGVDLYLADGLVFDLQNVLDIDTAKGVQLDLIGKILGCKRNIFGLNINTKFFSFEKEPPDISYGFSDKNQLSEGFWKKYQNSTGSAYRLSDADYRLLLKFKALYNIRRGSWGQLDELYYRAFGTDVYVENNKDLSVTYIVKPSAVLAVQAAQFLGYIAAPLGIGSTISNTNNYYLWTVPVSFNGSKPSSAIGFGDNKYVIISQNGQVLISTDGKEWTVSQSTLSSSVHWKGITYASSKFWAVGQEGKVSYSSNGTSWQQTTANLGNSGWCGIAYGASKFVVISADGKISTSSNGTSNWSSPTTVSNLGNRDWIAMVFDGTNFIAISKNGYKSTSSDGTTWTLAVQNANLKNLNWRALSSDGTNTIALTKDGYISVSANNGASWSKAKLNINLNNKLDNKLTPDWVSLTNNGTDFIAIDTNAYISYT